MVIILSLQLQLGRETKLQRAEDCEKRDRIWKCAFEILARVIEDKVYKVYVACIECFRTLLRFSQGRSHLSSNQLAPCIRPILQTILTKCGDSNKRMAEL